MRLANRIDALWEAVREDSARGAQARRRAGAAAAMAAFLLTLLASIGLLDVLLVAVAVAAAGAAIALGVRRLRRNGLPIGRVVVAARSWIASHRHVPPAVSRARARLVSARPSFRRPAVAWPARQPIDRRREALRLNADGAQLRRAGAYAEAAEQHRLALALFRELEDRRSEALTLNNLALALDRAGDPIALDLFEEAATTLGELGEEQDEGQVIANLALAFRRRGIDDRSAEVLDVALEKLDPASHAYRKVENLRQAS